jgi:hypothetical protein
MGGPKGAALISFILNNNFFFTICLLLASGLIILNDCDHVYFLHYFQHFQVVILCSFYLK